MVKNEFTVYFTSARCASQRELPSQAPINYAVLGTVLRGFGFKSLGFRVLVFLRVVVSGFRV